MSEDFSIQTLQKICPTVPLSIIQDFLDRMDPEYFTQFSKQSVAEHLTLIGTLTGENPCAIRIHKKPKLQFQLAIVAYDYYSEFATICGLLSSFGLDIRNAIIYTYTERRVAQNPVFHQRTGLASRPRIWRARPSQQPSGLSRKKVVDVFNVQLLSGFSFGKSEQTHFTNSLKEMIQLLDGRHFRHVRNQVNRRLVETLGHLNTSTSDVVHPVEITFNNTMSTDATIMDIRSTDTPAFLYTLTNALTMRGIYVSKAKIEVNGNTAHNELHVRGRTGRKIENALEQQELISTTALIKEFSHFLTWAPNPGKALEHFDQLLDELQGEQSSAPSLSLLEQRKLLAHLAKLFGSSDFLWEDLLRRQHANLLPAMSKFQQGPIIRSKLQLSKALKGQLNKYKTSDRKKTCLNNFKDQELFRIDMKHMLEETSLPEFSQALTNLAEVVLEQALFEARHKVNKKVRSTTRSRDLPYRFAIFGLGKLGGRELGYASDIEVLFVYDLVKKEKRTALNLSTDFFEELVQEILRWIEAKNEGIFHIDTRLRPYGEKGLLANTLKEIQTYYHPNGSSAPFERQALIKLRHVAGDKTLGQAVESHSQSFVYSQEPWPLEEALHLRNRQITELVPSNNTHVKYSPGGLIDIEYLAQYYQLMYGHSRPSLQFPNTLQALQGLKQENLLQHQHAEMLTENYLFFRKAIDALRIVRGHAQDLLLPDPESDSMIFLARRLGYMTEDWKAGAMALNQEIRRRMRQTRNIFTQYCKTH